MRLRVIRATSYRLHRAATRSASAASVPAGSAIEASTPPASSATEYALSTPGRRRLAPPHRHLPRQHHARHPAVGGRPRHGGDQLPAQRLPVEAALPGDGERRGVERGVEADELAHQPRTGHPAGTAREQRGAETARGACPWLVADLAARSRRRARRRSGRGRRPARRPRPRRHPSAGRTPRRRRAVRAAGCRRRPRPPGARRRARGVPSSRAQRARAAPPSGQAVAGVVDGDRTERGEHPGAAVGGGRAAQPDDDLVDAGVAGVGDQLTDAAGRDAPRRRRVRAARAGRGAARTRPPTPGSRWCRAAATVPATGSPNGPVTARSCQLPAERGVQDLDEAGTAVGQRQEAQLVRRRVPAPAERDGLGRGRGAQRSAEGVRSDHHTHVAEGIPRTLGT